MQQCNGKHDVDCALWDVKDGSPSGSMGGELPLRLSIIICIFFTVLHLSYIFFYNASQKSKIVS